jgi:SPP1 family predicted phage head-tail adaptor
MGEVAAGSLNKRITIQRRKAGVDSFNQPVLLWEDVAKVWANIRVTNGMSFVGAEFETGGTEISRTLVSMRIRFIPGITAAMRVLHRGDVYEIRAVLPDLAHREFMDLGCAFGTGSDG